MHTCNESEQDDKCTETPSSSFFDMFDMESFYKDSKLHLAESTVLHKEIFNSEENLFHLFFKRISSTFDIKIEKSKLGEFVNELRDEAFSLISCTSDARNKLTENVYFVHKDYRVLIRLYITTEKEYDADTEKLFTASVFFDIEQTKGYSLAKQLKDKYIYNHKSEHNIYLFQKDEYNEMTLQPYDIKGFDLDISENYNKDFGSTHEKIIDWAKDFSLPNNRIVLLHGEPGAGKTNYIKYLMNALPTVRKIYIPPFYVAALGDPAFLGFIKNYSNSILIIEDAEKVLISREQDEENSAMSIILNLSDGIMGSVLNFKIVATFNTDENRIDSALKRRGRMFMKYHFGKLSKDKTKTLHNKLYSADPPEEEMTLADIYNSDSNGNTVAPKRQMGFIH